jgi:hypothetical protein
VNSVRFAKDGSQAQVANLDLTLVAIDEDIVTFEIPMDNRRMMTVEIQKTHQDLPASMLHCSDMNPLVHLPIPKTKTYSIK